MCDLLKFCGGHKNILRLIVPVDIIQFGCGIAVAGSDGPVDLKAFIGLPVTLFCNGRIPPGMQATDEHPFYQVGRFFQQDIYVLHFRIGISRCIVQGDTAGAQVLEHGFFIQALHFRIGQRMGQEHLR